MKINRWVWPLLVCALATGCSAKKNDNPRKDTVLTAYRLIDDQRTDEAIELLENAIANDPTYREFKSVLASAYAHKGGIKIQRLVPALGQIDKLNQGQNRTTESQTSLSGTGNVNLRTLGLSALMSRFSIILDTFVSIPTATVEQAAYIKHGIQILNEIDEHITQEEALYRAILELVLTKHLLVEEFVGEISETLNIDDSNCEISADEVTESSKKVATLLFDLFRDIAIAQPAQEASMRQLRERTSNSIANLKVTISTVTAVAESDKLFLKRTAIQLGFGKIIQCGIK